MHASSSGLRWRSVQETGRSRRASGNSVCVRPESGFVTACQCTAAPPAVQLSPARRREQRDLRQLACLPARLVRKGCSGRPRWRRTVGTARECPADSVWWEVPSALVATHGQDPRLVRLDKGRGGNRLRRRASPLTSSCERASRSACVPA